MKTLKLLAAGIILLVSTSMEAQVSVNLNIGTAPNWGPRGYSQVDYYYLPDIQAYYDIRASQFIYFGRNQWVRSRYLPRQYRNYDLYSGYKVVLNDYHGRSPYTHYKSHRTKYHKGYRGQHQSTIGHRYNNHRDDGHRYSNDKKNYSKERYSTNRRYSDNHRNSNDKRYSKDKHRKNERNGRDRD